MSLYHNFLCLQEGMCYTDYMNYLCNPSDVKIHDDLIHYINDTLKWVPSINPANLKEWQGYGLNLYGATVINKEGSDILYHAIASWAHLFSKAPAKLELTGSWTSEIDDEGVEAEGYYDQLKFDRDVVVKNLKTLATYANRVGSGELFILHLGI